MRRENSGERGFTILEALIATALLVLVAFTGLAVCKMLGVVSIGISEDDRGAAALDTQTSDLRSDAASALAVFVPTTDFNGHANSGQELDFFSKTETGRAILWRYFYDSAAHTLTRWDYDESGAAGVRDVRTGQINPAATYPPLRGITRFSATAIPADELGAAGANAYHGLGGFFDHVPRALPVHYSVAGSNGTDIVGGNTVIAITLANANTARLVHLAAGSLPSGFTVTGAPVWHAVVYRVDQTHRSWLGVVGKSHVFINARVDVSYDHWVNNRITWCDINLLGNPDGLDGHDPHADYKPNEPIEQSASILAACRRNSPHVPSADDADNPPDPGAVHPPLPQDTPPPCWTQPGPQGRCWPADPPAGWQPPGLLPGETPPADWCAAYARVPVCRRVNDHPGRGL